MSRDRAIVAGVVIAAVLVVGGIGYVALRGSNTGKHTPPPPPAAVTKVLKEDEVNTITLQAEAVEKLGVQTGVIERKPTPRARQYGGEVIVPVGKSVIVSAPLNGSLKAASGGLLRPGQPVKK